MTRHPIKQLNLPENECPHEECPQYCRQWSSDLCLAASNDGLACGLCRFDDGFMKPNECYRCAAKAEGKGDAKKKGGKR